MIAPRHRALFAECASPDAIAPELKKAQAALRAAERTVTWLADLLAERNAQIAAGTWPPAAPADRKDTP